MALRRDSALLGKTPPGATHWTLSRKGALSWESCTYRSGSEWVHEMPIADLTLAFIRRRHGDGAYRVSFLALGRGGRQLLGNGRVFEISGSSEQSLTPRPGRGGADAGAAPDDHSDMVRALLRAAEGKRTPDELFEALAIPTGMGLSSLFASLERVAERLETIERRLASLEGAGEPGSSEAPPAGRGMERVLDKLEAIEQRLAQAAPPARKLSPTGRRGRDSPLPR